jgi:hypothetical protein
VNDRLTFSLDEPASGVPLFAEATYKLDGERAGQATAIAFDHRGKWSLSTWPVTLPPGPHTVFLPLTAERPVTTVALAELPPGLSLCVTGVRVVRPVYRADGACFGMDEYGAAEARTVCPVRAEGQ